MKKYEPPFVIDNEMLSMVSSIMKKIGKLDNYDSFNKMPILRRNNRISSIHASLAIEANSLTFEEVKDVIDGKNVLGPKKEILEVKNAYLAYEKIPLADPYSIKDLKDIHATMTKDIISESGKFRKGDEGVFDENGNCIHVCPPPDKVPELMKELFDFMKDNKDKIHPLILSSIFHYEFVFIHPFSDGNGRCARLWQNIMLYNFENVFLYIPLESQIEKYQDDYYNAISESNVNGNSNSFIKFMLKMIDEVLDDLMINLDTEITHINSYVVKLLKVMDNGICYSLNELMELLNMKSRVSFRSNYLLPALDLGFVKMKYPDNKTSKNQKYYKD